MKVGKAFIHKNGDHLIPGDDFDSEGYSDKDMLHLKQFGMILEAEAKPEPKKRKPAAPKVTK